MEEPEVLVELQVKLVVVVTLMVVVRVAVCVVDDAVPEDRQKEDIRISAS